MRNIIITKECAIANMKRVIEILESDIELKPNWYNESKELAELKRKMHEVRRDTKDIEKFMK